MIDLTKRTDQKELLDGDNIPFEDIKMNMLELNTINTLLGGHSITIKGIQYLIENKRELYTICEMGCGGGDNLMIVAEWCKKNNINARFIGIDIKPECIAFCKERFSHSDVEWICSDYRKINFENKLVRNLME